MTTIKRLGLLLTLMMVLGVATPAKAHGYVVRAIPENRAVLDRAPTRVQYWFSEALEPRFSEIRVRNQDGDIIAEGGVSEDNNTLMSLRLPNDLPQGAYVVELRPAFASDGHVVAESRVFFVGDEVGGIDGQGASDQAEPLEVLWRTIIYAGTILLFGTFAVYAWVLVPAWGNKQYKAGLLPPRVITRLMWIIGIALFITFAGNILALIQQTMAFFPTISFGEATQEKYWSLVRIGSRFGDIWNFRMLFLLVVTGMFGASIFFRQSQPETVRPFWVANGWMVTLILGTFSILSHAAGSLRLPWFAMGIDWLHTVAVGFWIGGLMVLVFVLPIALKPYQGEQRRVALLAVMKRFSWLAMACVAVVVATGIYSASNWFYTTDDIESNFALALLIKILMIVLLFGVGAVHHIALRPKRYQQFTALSNRFNTFKASLRLEALMAIVVLGAVGWLTATPVPTPEFADQTVETPAEIQVALGYTVVMSISPGGLGVNTYDVLITQDGQAVENVGVSLTQVNPERDWRGDTQVLEAVDEGLYVSAGDELDETGRWWSLLDIIPSNGDTTRIAFEWNITNEASVVETVPLTWINWLALIGVISAIIWAGFPALKQFYDLLDLTVINLVVSIGIIIITMIFIVLGFSQLKDTKARYDSNLHPAPEVINTVLPSQTSINRGEGIFTERCLGWDTNERDFTVLVDRLDRFRDDELFMATRDGWRDLLPCVGDLSSFQRWDLVNYLRTLRTD